MATIGLDPDSGALLVHGRAAGEVRKALFEAHVI
jgi:hypothetical protein